jgi:hypothetical protein
MEIKKMTPEEANAKAREEIGRLGGYAEYRRQSTGRPDRLKLDSRRFLQKDGHQDVALTERVWDSKGGVGTARWSQQLQCFRWATWLVGADPDGA